MRAPEFVAYVSPARAAPELWRLLLGILVILFVYVSSFALLLVALYPIILATIGPVAYIGWVRGLAAPDGPWQVVALLVTFVGMLLGTVLATAACHFRGPGTLFGPRDETLRGFFLSLAVLVPFYAVLQAVAWWLFAPEPNLDAALWLRFLPLALPLLLLQTSAEEMLFRGYLQQQLAVRFAARWVWMGLPALGFALLHLDPTTGNSATWMVVATTFAFALIAADLTEQTGSLGAAIALHFVNNVNAMLIVSVKGTITGLALYVTPFDQTDSGAIGFGLALDILLMVIVWRLLRFVLGR